MKRLAQRCALCGGETTVREVEYLVSGSRDVVRIQVEAEVCLKCGQRTFEPDTVRRFEEMRRKLDAGDVSALEPLGRTYRG